MSENRQPLGIVKLVQIQPERMIMETPDGMFFDPTHRLEVDRLTVTGKGIIIVLSAGDTMLDVHHVDYPNGRNKPGNTVSIGFTAHYQAMRARYGQHVIDGSAGENVIIDFHEEVWLRDLGKQVLFENPRTGETALMDVNRFAAPCEPFVHFCASSQHQRLPAETVKEHLQFLGEGRRGFLLSLHASQEQAFISPGDRVFAVLA